MTSVEDETDDEDCYDLEELGLYNYKYDEFEYTEIENDEFLNHCIELLRQELYKRCVSELAEEELNEGDARSCEHKRRKR